MSNGFQVPPVPPMSSRQAEQRALQVVRDYRPGLLEEPGAFPARHFYEHHLEKQYGVKTYVTDLPDGLEGATGHDGRIVIAGDVYERLCDDDGRARLTAVHEAAHAIVHLQYLQKLNCQVAKGGEPVLYRVRDIPAYASPEWQASRIAGAILMPLPAVRALVKRHGLETEPLKRTFLVSHRAAEVRLEQLSRLGWLSAS